MQFFFKTYPNFHAQHFSQVRLGLCGKKTIEAVLPGRLPSALEPVVVASTASRSVSHHQDASNSLSQLTKHSVLSKAIRYFLNALMVISLVVLLAILGPYVYYQLAPADTQPITALEEGTPLGGSFDQGAQATVSATPIPLPPQDPNLPAGEWLIIPRIGVRTELQATQDEEEALAKGVWMVPEYGRPGQKDKPVILAAHRYGWQWWWQSDYWKYHSFYNLPELQPGDIIETIVDQRKYTYEIYAGEEGEEITDYYADMILYTCKYLNSPLRHFRYARLVDWTKDTQKLES